MSRWGSSATAVLLTVAGWGLAACGHENDLDTGSTSVGDACASYTISADELGGEDEAFATTVTATCDDGDGVNRPCAVAAPDEDGDRAVTCEQAD